MRGLAGFKALIVACLYCCLIVGGVAFGPAAKAEEPARARTLNEIRTSGKIVIGVYADKPPFGHRDEEGVYRGYDIYFAEQIARDLGVRPEYVPMAPSERVEALESGRVDLILANFTVTPQRAALVDFALPYMKVSLGVVSPTERPITNVEQLRGKTLIVCRGTTSESYFSAHHPEVTLLRFDQRPDSYEALLAGKGDALASDNTAVLAWALAREDFTVGIPSLGSLDTIAPAVRKGNVQLKNWLNAEIRRLGRMFFFHSAYAETLAPVYGKNADPSMIVVEGGVVKVK